MKALHFMHIQVPTPVTGTHFFTISSAEKDHVIATWPAIYAYEGIAWHANTTQSAGWVPVYRFFNTKTGTHFYTTSAAERDNVIDTLSWYSYEGIAYYVRQDAPKYELVSNGSGGYYDKTECVKDLKTGLIWEGKPTGGVRMNSNRYTNFDSTTTLQKYNVALGAFVAPTQGDIDASTNSIGYKNSVNASSLCGATNWRLPSKDELLTIVNSANSPVYDTLWFPNTADGTGNYPSSSFYWSSTPTTSASIAMYVNFIYGNASSDTRGYTSGSGTGLFVRLVR
jgi:hypothetical protein